MLSAALVATLGACASGTTNALTLSTAKSRTLAIEKQIAAFVPADIVSNSQVTTTSKVIFACTGHDDESYWPGTVNLSLTKGAKTESILSAIAAKWNSKSGWSVFKVTGNDGNPSLDMKSPDGSSFTVEFADGPSFSINSLSACFPNAGLAGKSRY